MSIQKNITIYPATTRNFDVNTNTLSQIAGCFLAKKDFYFSDEDDFSDYDVWQAAMLANNIFPLHHIFEFNPQDEEMIIGTSLQDFTYKITEGKYKHKIGYIWSMDFHQIVEAYSGTDLQIFYYDRNYNIYGIKNDSNNIYGFETNRILLDKLPFSTQTTPSFSFLDVEIKNAKDFQENGIVKKVSWFPELVDKLFTKITVEFIDVNNLNFTAVYNGNPVSDLASSDITVTDDVNGELDYTFFSYAGGVYQMGGFVKQPGSVSTELTKGCLQINSTLYLGATRYLITSYVPFTANAVWGDGENEVWGDGNNAVYGDHIP